MCYVFKFVIEYFCAVSLNMLEHIYKFSSSMFTRSSATAYNCRAMLCVCYSRNNNLSLLFQNFAFIDCNIYDIETVRLLSPYRHRHMTWQSILTLYSILYVFIQLQSIFIMREVHAYNNPRKNRYFISTLFYNTKYICNICRIKYILQTRIITIFI